MVWYTTRVRKEQDLAAELQRLQDAAVPHTIVDIVSRDGSLIIISHAAS